jgi:hypothetical protein
MWRNWLTAFIKRAVFDTRTLVGDVLRPVSVRILLIQEIV